MAAPKAIITKVVSPAHSTARPPLRASIGAAPAVGCVPDTEGSGVGETVERRHTSKCVAVEGARLRSKRGRGIAQNRRRRRFEDGGGFAPVKAATVCVSEPSSALVHCPLSPPSTHQSDLDPSS
ncbi:hypothetical protein MAC_04139 [Metarhizium acridum CQMa 102]|uniref:Uncharacterized protein n=1 Tax=Metarhizium acridum (strain CQMa 102) TaxID=655827 RepID=E9E2P1_METAQ|nr:uncharacterized protein MAC_04139 [Metarhizium acridum CQMa 102]EFY89930.1 hypothetical protein MAC_04139 [Metarhizium acridum CQMa 102]